MSQIWAKIQAFDEYHWISWSLCSSPDVFHELREPSMCSHHPYFLTWAWFPSGYTTFSNHTVIRPLCLLACPQILTVYLHVLRCVLHFTKPVKCLLKTTDDAKIKQVFSMLWYILVFIHLESPKWYLWVKSLYKIHKGKICLKPFNLTVSPLYLTS